MHSDVHCTPTGHCEPRIKEKTRCTANRSRESTILRWCSRQHNWRLSYRTSAHPPTLYRSLHLTLLRSSSCSHCYFLLPCSPLASTTRIVVPSVPRDGGTVNSTNADAICILATTDTIKRERYSSNTKLALIPREIYKTGCWVAFFCGLSDDLTFYFLMLSSNTYLYILLYRMFKYS